METEKTRIQLDMPCICSEDGKKNTEIQRLKAAKLLECDPDDPNYVSRLVAELTWGYQTKITSIRMDMWFGVCAESTDEMIFVPCDRVEDGITEIFLHMHEKGKNVKT